MLALSTVASELGRITYAITSVSLRQRLCPPQLLGRVNAMMRFLIMGLFSSARCSTSDSSCDAGRATTR